MADDSTLPATDGAVKGAQKELEDCNGSIKEKEQVNDATLATVQLALEKATVSADKVKAEGVSENSESSEKGEHAKKEETEEQTKEASPKVDIVETKDEKEVTKTKDEKEVAKTASNGKKEEKEWEPEEESSGKNDKKEEGPEAESNEESFESILTQVSRLSVREKEAKSRLEERKKFFLNFDTQELRSKKEAEMLEQNKEDRDEKMQDRRNIPASETNESSRVASESPEITKKPPTAGGEVDKTLANLFEDTKKAGKELDATTAIRKLLSVEKNPPIKEVIATGVVPILVTFLKRHAEPILQFEASWALTNITSGSSDDTKAVLQAGALPALVELLWSKNIQVKEQAVWAIGNIAGDSVVTRDLCLSMNALTPLLEVLTSENRRLSLTRNTIWTVSNLCRGKPPPGFASVAAAVPVVAAVLSSADEEILCDACWTLSFLSDGPNERIQAVIDTGISNRLVELMGHKKLSIQIPALRTVGNLVTGDDGQTDVLLNAGVLEQLSVLLFSHKTSIVKEACWTISNVTAGTPAQIQRVITSGLIPRLIQLMEAERADIRKEACWAIANATSGGNKGQIAALVNHGCLASMSKLITGTQEVHVLAVILEGLENILKCGAREFTDSNPYATEIEKLDCLDKIENLQLHQNTEIYDKAAAILQNYFETEEVEEQGEEAKVDAEFA